MSLIQDTSTFAEIATEIEKITQKIATSGGEIDENIETQLKHVENLLVNKTQGIVDFLSMSDVYFSSLKAKINELQEKHRVETNKIENFKAHIVHVMKAKEIPKLQTPDGLTEIKLKKPLNKVLVEDEDKVPAEWVATETKMFNKIDLKGAKPHLENGESIPGLRLVVGKESFSVKTKSIKG